MKRKPQNIKKVVLLCLLVLCFVLYKGAVWFLDNKAGNLKCETQLYVYPDTTPEAVFAQLEASLLRPKSLRRMFEAKKVAEFIKPGHYSFGPDASSVFIARSLNNGWQSPVRLTISGSLRQKGEIARKIASQMMLDSASVAAALNDKDLLKSYGYTPQTVYALFIPDSYQIFWTASVKDILDTQKAAQAAFWTEANTAKARNLGLSKLQVSTLASIVKGESKVKSDYSKIAGVYIARLRKGMPLQADPTIAFCFDYAPNRILKRHLQVDSPYNTYRNKGLPPGPICTPDKAYLEAVLNPNLSEGYLYFCASATFDGSHLFAKNYSEHLRNAREFQRALSLSKP